MGEYMPTPARNGSAPQKGGSAGLAQGGYQSLVNQVLQVLKLVIFNGADSLRLESSKISQDGLTLSIQVAKKLLPGQVSIPERDYTVSFAFDAAGTSLLEIVGTNSTGVGIVFKGNGSPWSLVAPTLFETNGVLQWFDGTATTYSLTPPATSPSSLGYTATGNVTFNVTRYLPLGSGSVSTTEPDTALLVTRSGTISRLYVNAAANTLDNNAVITVRKNGVDTTLTVTLATTVLTGNDTTHSFSVAAGDLITVKAVTTASGSGNLLQARIGMEFS